MGIEFSRKRRRGDQLPLLPNKEFAQQIRSMLAPKHHCAASEDDCPADAQFSDALLRTRANRTRSSWWKLMAVVLDLPEPRD
jgi:hypothetical protein